jgi:hypothetical protein
MQLVIGVLQAYVACCMHALVDLALYKVNV